jgi:hypothetical protein
MDTVKVNINGGPSIAVAWLPGMNVQHALDSAYNQLNNSSPFTYALQYYGAAMGYLVVMIDHIYESTSAPYTFWELFINGIPAIKGIDNVILNRDDVVTFSLEKYNSNTHPDSTIRMKHTSKLRTDHKAMALESIF